MNHQYKIHLNYVSNAVALKIGGKELKKF